MSHLPQHLQLKSRAGRSKCSNSKIDIWLLAYFVIFGELYILNRIWWFAPEPNKRYFYLLYIAVIIYYNNVHNCCLFQHNQHQWVLQTLIYMVITYVNMHNK